MFKKIMTALVLVAISLMTMDLQCDKESILMPVVKYAFKESLLVNPYQTVYKLGDTLWIELDLPNNELFDTISGKMIQYDSAKFQVQAEVNLLYSYPFDYTGPYVSFVFPDFSIGESYSNYFPGSHYVLGNFTFGCGFSTMYNFRFGIVMQKKGVFETKFVNNQVDFCCSCNNDYVIMKYGFKIDDNHLDFYKQVPFNNVGSSTDPNVIQSLQDKTAIVFEVE